MLGSGGDQVDAGGLDAAVAQDVRQLGHVPADPVERPGEQVPQVVGKDLGGLHPGPGAQRLHLRPDLPAGKAAAASGEKDLAGGGLLLPGVLQQLPAQLAGQQDGADLALQADHGPACQGGFHREIADLADPDAGGADGLQQQGQPLPAQGAGGAQQAVVLLPGQVPAVIPEQPPLDAQRADPQLRPAQKGEEAVQCRQLGVDGGRGLSAGQQGGLPGSRRILGEGALSQPGGKGRHVPAVLLHGAGALLLPAQLVPECLHLRFGDRRVVHPLCLLHVFSCYFTPRRGKDSSAEEETLDRKEEKPHGMGRGAWGSLRASYMPPMSPPAGAAGAGGCVVAGAASLAPPPAAGLARFAAPPFPTARGAAGAPGEARAPVRKAPRHWAVGLAFSLGLVHAALPNCELFQTIMQRYKEK